MDGQPWCRTLAPCIYLGVFVRTVNVWGIAFLCIFLAGGLAAQTSPAPAWPPAVPDTTASATSDVQTQSPSSGQSSPASRGSSKVVPPQTPQASTSNDRLFWTLPNFLTVENAHNIPPLTAAQKFKVVLRTSFDPVEYPYVGFLAGIGQATDSEPAFGQGAAGYGKRYASTFGDNTIENFMTGAILPSVLHQDPRYYQLGQGSFKHRLGYSISRIFVTRNDSGRNQFNASEVLGSGISATLATYSYHPAADRTFANTMSVWWTQVGWDTVAITVKEFWPDIRRRLQKRHHPAAVVTPALP